MKIETTLTRIDVCANCGGRGCDQCRPASANIQCTNCGGNECKQCSEYPPRGQRIGKWTEIACYVAQTDPEDWFEPVYLLALSLIDCEEGSMLMLSLMPDEDEPDADWESDAITVAMDWRQHIRPAPHSPRHFTVTTFNTDDGPKLTISVMIPKEWDAMSLFELSMGGLKVVGWADAIEATAH